MREHHETRFITGSRILINLDPMKPLTLSRRTAWITAGYGLEGECLIDGLFFDIDTLLAAQRTLAARRTL